MREEKERIEKEKTKKKENVEKKKFIPKETPAKPNKPPNKPIVTGNKAIGGMFAKMLADKMRLAPPQAKLGGPRPAPPKPVEIEKGLDYKEILEEKPIFKPGRKPAKVAFSFDDDEQSDNQGRIYYFLSIRGAYLINYIICFC